MFSPQQQTIKYEVLKYLIRLNAEYLMGLCEGICFFTHTYLSFQMNGEDSCYYFEGNWQGC